MTTPTDAYFDTLSRRGHVPALRNRRATIRFNIADGAPSQTWGVIIDNGDVQVAPSYTGDADCVITATRSLFDDVFTGGANAMAAMLRGEMRTDGDVELLVATRHLLAAEDGARS